MDERFVKGDGSDIYTGCELLLKGALESGTALITGYPGSPISEVFDGAFAHRDLLKTHGVLAELANNEALAVARLNGARMAGARAMAVMKSVGLHVAADGLALGNLAEPRNAGGSIVVVGDDPWIDSTQINNDSRFLSQHLHMPVLEPSTFQELKDWIEAAYELSSAANLYITYLVTTNQADGGGTVWVRPNREPSVSVKAPVALDTSSIDLDRNVLLPPRTWDREATLKARVDTLWAEVRRRGLNHFVRPSPPLPHSLKEEGGRSAVAFVTSGISYAYLQHALAELGLLGRFPILKLGLTYPLDPASVLDAAQSADMLVVIEEKRAFIEAQAVQILHDAHQRGLIDRAVPVWGKRFPGELAGIPEQRGIHTSVLMERLVPLLLGLGAALSEDERARLRREEAILSATTEKLPVLPARTPTFCPGCPHRDSSSVFLEIKRDLANSEYMRRQHGQAPVDLVFHGETGCFTMLMFEPNQSLMHNYSGMGLGGGTGAGLDPFVTNKQVVFLGDSTFFHSGMIAISDAIKNRQDITFVILDNKTTAMTGHQPTPGTGIDLMGERTPAQDIERIVSGMASGTAVPVRRVNPGERDSYRALLEDTVLEDGVKVVIADKECGLVYHKRRRRAERREALRDGFLKEERHINITPEVCEFCLECTTTTGCPGLAIEDTLMGPKITTDLSTCVSDGACAKVKACPSFEEVVIRRQGPRRDRPERPSAQGLPVPMPAPLDGHWYAYIAGVGGQGAGLVSEIFMRAAQAAGYRVLFLDKKGLAVRNGAVYGHLLVTTQGGTLAPVVPYGKADLLLGLDLLESVRALGGTARVAHPDHTAIVVNSALTPTIRMLLGKDPAAKAGWDELLRGRAKPYGVWSEDLSAATEHQLGHKLYTNVALIGAAFQVGALPFSLETLEAAITASAPPDERDANLDAFRLGRLLVAAPERVRLPQPAESYASMLAAKAEALEADLGPGVAGQYRLWVEDTARLLELDDLWSRHLALRVYELIRYDGLRWARRYLDLVRSVAAKDRRSRQFAATRAVLQNAFKVMAIKDEIYVADLLTRPEKIARDARRFGLDLAAGDRLQYRHLNRPEFTVAGRSFRWNMVTRNWQLKLVKRAAWLRRWLRGWHAEERAFRDWYLALAARFDGSREDHYDAWVQMLQSPTAVRGYREVRRPSMANARRNVETILNRLRETPGPLEVRE